MIVTLVYRMPRTRQKQSQQLAQVNAVPLLSPDEKLYLRLANETRNAVVVGAEVELTVQYQTLPAIPPYEAFETLFPTAASQTAAVNNLLTDALSKRLNNVARQTSVTIV